MKDIVRLVKTLRPKEVQLIRNIYKSQPRGSSKENMCLRLFNHILHQKIRNNKDAYSLICPNKHISLVSQVKKKLESDILNLIVVSCITDDREKFNKSDFTCQKNLLLGKILISRGLTEEAFRILQLTSEEAEKAELHDIKINCDDILRSIYIADDLEANVQQYKESVDMSMENLNGFQHARSINYPFIYAKSFSEPCESFNIDLEKLTLNINKSTSRRAVYWYKLAIIHYYIQKKDYTKARSYSIHLLNKSLENNDMVSAFERSEFYLQLSRLLIYLQEPGDAIQAAESCIKDLPTGIAEISLPFQMIFRGYLRKNNLVKASEIVDRAFKYGLEEQESRFGIWYLFKAAVLFALKKYKDANHVLVFNEQHFDDNIQQKAFIMIFELINILETGDLYWFEYKLESFRKRIKRLNGKETDRIRYLYILLNKIKGNNYKFKNLNADGRASSPSLPSFHGPAWDPLGSEIIDMEEWLVNKPGSVLVKPLKFQY